MRIQIKKCRTCGARGLGPGAVKLYPFEGNLYCRADFKDALTWDECRYVITSGIERSHEFYKEMAKFVRAGLKVVKSPAANWKSYIHELCGIAGWALEVGDRRTFVYYSARAVLAWGMREAQEIYKMG